MADYTNVHEDSATNGGAISAGASEFFFSSENNRAQMLLHQQSFNSVEIINDSSVVVDIDFDAPAGDTASKRRRIFAKASLVLEPKDNVYFSTIKVTNRDGATAIAQDELKMVARIMKERR